MILFKLKDWKLTTYSANVQQYDNLSSPIVISGEFPPEYSEWKVYIAYKENLDIVPLVENEDGTMTADLTDEQLSFSGLYAMQVFARSGDKVRHSSLALVDVPCSLSGDAHWPELPKVFSDALERAERAAETAAEETVELVRQEMTGYVDSAQTAKTGAETAQEAAETAQEAAESAQTSAETAQAAAEDAAYTATTKASEATQSATDANTAKTAAETAQTLAESAKDDAVSAKDAAETAQVYAESAVEHYPRIGDNGNWLVWSNGVWVDTNLPATGARDDETAFSFHVDADGHLILVSTSAAEDVFDFAINANGHLIMSLEGTENA